MNQQPLGSAAPPRAAEANDTSPPGVGPRQRTIADMIDLSVAALPALRRGSGLYCFDMPMDTLTPRGESVRYSLMVLLGMQRASAAGIADVVDLGELWQTCLDRRNDFTAGDVGLALWADSRGDGTATASLLEQYARLVPADAALRPLVGMEIAWSVIGLAHALDRAPDAARPLEQVTRHFEQERRADSGLYFHDAASPIRRHLPNFATEIYSLLALSTLARLDLRPQARRHAEVLAGHLVRMQLADGGWPWLFDADRACVAERYEVYSVHQDAMAPMALLDLSELTGDERWADAAIAGLAWSHGANELQADLFDEDAAFAHRSIRRTPPYDRLALVANSAAARSTGRPLRVDGGTQVEVDATCRPYHLGWILEAWAGRPEWAERAGSFTVTRGPATPSCPAARTTGTPPRRTVQLFGLPVDALTMDETVAAARAMVAEGSPHQHVVINAAKVVAADRDPELAATIRSCDLVNADGTSVVWASRLLRRPVPERVTGIDLFERLVEAADQDGRSVYLLGATEEVVQAVEAELTRRHPGLRIAGVRDGYWDDEQAVVDEVRAAAPDYLFLAIPSPQKEQFLEAHLQEMGVPFDMGVGGSFDVIAGVVGRAPLTIQRLGLEWVWRLGQEPRRMWKRYLVGNTRFVLLTVRELCTRHDAEPPALSIAHRSDDSGGLP